LDLRDGALMIPTPIVVLGATSADAIMPERTVMGRDS
jgi:hypothetical protein